MYSIIFFSFSQFLSDFPQLPTHVLSSLFPPLSKEKKNHENQNRQTKKEKIDKTKIIKTKQNKKTHKTMVSVLCCSTTPGLTLCRSP